MNKKQLKFIAICVIAILGTFLPETFPTFFGDFVCNKEHSLGSWYAYHRTDTYLHYGVRHWMYIVMCLVLLIWNIASLANDDKI